jgi:predicted acylesterase/phospholipase RssA
MTESLPGPADRLKEPGPKRILALDGGGVRGMLTLGILERIEAELQSRAGGKEYRLCDYFDLIAGTSTGAIIASALAIGLSVKEIQDFYRKHVPAIFKRRKVSTLDRKSLLRAKYRRGPMIDALEAVFKEHAEDKNLKLGSPRIRTGLMVMIKQLCPTNHTWAVVNSPDSELFKGKGARIPNREYPVARLVRASGAAPTYFEPERLPTGAPGSVGDAYFVDGGVSPFNNPAVPALMAATTRGFGLCWPMGPENLLLVSVGTGFQKIVTSKGRFHSSLFESLILATMDECNWFSQAILQWLSKTDTPWRVQGAVGDLQKDALCGTSRLRYLRYDVQFTRTSAVDREGRSLGITGSAQVERLAKLDAPENLELLLKLGQAAGTREVKPDHFPPRFNRAMGAGQTSV